MPLTPPPPATQREANLETRIRLKLQTNQPLTTEEQHYLANLPGARDTPYP